MPDTLRMVWEGVDGSSWELLDPLSPVRLLSIQGLGMPQFLHQWSESGARDELRYEDTAWGSNIALMTVEVGDDYPIPGRRTRRRDEEWRELDRAWDRALSAEEEGTLVVISDAGRRSLKLRLNTPNPIPADKNPADRGLATYTLDMVAGEHPWWQGDTVDSEFAWSEETEPFFGGATGEVLLFISQTTDTESARISNLGDREAWPVWWAEGPFETVHLGVGDRVVVLPIPQDVGRRIHVDSYRNTITDEAGQSLWPLMGFATPTFAPIPPGGSVPLHIELVGASSGAKVGVSITPRYRRPW